MPEQDALVVGGGLAGGAVATLLAQAGRRVTLLERSRGPHDKVCGEFLSGEALQSLQLLGIDACALGALPIETLRLTRGSRTTEQPLPFAAMSLTRRVLDEALLARAARAGATVCRGAAVDSLTADGEGGWVAATAEHRYRAPAAFLATGKHDLRGHGRPTDSGFARHNGLLAFNQYFRLQPEQQQRLRGMVEVCLFRDGYCGLQLVEDGTANLGLLVRQTAFKPWPALLQSVCGQSACLAERLRDAEPILAKPLALSHLPYGYRRLKTATNLWALGDQAAVIPSFSGDGMSIALHSGVMAAQMFLQGHTAPMFQQALHRQLGGAVTLATLVSRMLVGAPAVASAMCRIPGVMRAVALRTRVPLE